MQTKVPSVQVNETDPFSGDLLGRKSAVLNLTRLIQSMSTPMVLSVNGRWGTGKTTFLDMWSKHLATEGFPALKFNAWETDFSEDPLVAFLGEMETGLSVYLKTIGEQTAAWEQCKKIGGLIAKRGLSIAVKLTTAGLLKLDDLVEEIIVDGAGNAVDDAVAAYETTRNKISEFKENLGKVIASLQSEHNRPLVIFVDELDRCRPTYAIELLERIKHLFDQPGIVFVLAMDREQLCHSIGAVYGAIDAAGYLRRFIDLEYALQAPSKEKFVEQLGIRFGVDKFFESRKINTYCQYEYDHLKRSLLRLVISFDLTLRDIKQVYSRLNIAIHTRTSDRRISTPLLTYLVVIRHCIPSFYARHTDVNKFVEDAIDALHTKKVQSEPEDYPLALIEGSLIALLPTKRPFESKFVKSYGSVLENGKYATPDRKYAEAVMNELDDSLQMGMKIRLSDLIDSIEFAAEINFVATT